MLLLQAACNITLNLFPFRYIILSPVSQWTQVKSWISQYLPQDQSITLKDLTPGSENYKKGCYSILGVIGHESEKILHRISDVDEADVCENKVRASHCL